MQMRIQTVADLGLALRATRRSQKVRLDDLAGTAGVSKQFVSDVEYGKSTVQLGLVLKLLEETGLALTIDLPEEAGTELATLRLLGGMKPRKQRAPSSRKRLPKPATPENA